MRAPRLPGSSVSAAGTVPSKVLAITSLRTSPSRISVKAAFTASASTAFGLASCPRNGAGRSMGPAVSFGNQAR